MKPEIKKKGKAGLLDVFIGYKLFQLRQLQGISQETLAEKAGITFQQIQKYEKGQNRISASRLYALTNIFNVDIRYFFDGYEQTPQANLTKRMEEVVEEGLPLLHKIYSIKDRSARDNAIKVCHQVLNMIRDK